MEKERGKRKIESLFGPGAISKENVQRISTYKPKLDQFDLSLICFTDTAHATLFTPHPLRPLPRSHPLLLVTLGRTTTPHASRTFSPALRSLLCLIQNLVSSRTVRITYFRTTAYF